MPLKLAASQLFVKAEFFLQAMMKYAAPASCPHCRSGDTALVIRKARVVRIVRCRSCGLVYSRPIYRSWLSANFYDRFYQAEGSTTAFPDDATLVALRATHFHGTDKDAGDRMGAIRATAPRDNPTLLELGCSWGYFLDQGRAAGFQVTGIEIGDTRRQFGVRKLGLEIVESIDRLQPERRFDVIYTAHVLEHFTDLSGIFPLIVGRLADHGTLFIEVPNVDVEVPASLSMVGAIHPVGFDSAFFQTNLRQYGLEVTGFFDTWADVPDHPSARSHKGVVILRARKKLSTGA